MTNWSAHWYGDGDGDGHGDGDGDLWVPEDDIYQAVALPIHLLGINAWCFFIQEN